MNERWINIAKTMAILAVIIDHTTGVLYTNPYIKVASYFSVSLFILIMGITSYWSYENSRETIGNKVLRRGKAFIAAYGISVVVYCIVTYEQLDFMTVIIHFVNFNVSGPHYYVLLYIQLLLLSPMVYLLVKWTKKDAKNAVTKHMFVVGGILFIASWTTNHSNILNIYGGGGKIAGGTYIFIMYLGMLIGVWYNKLKCKRRIIDFICMIFFAASAVLVWKFVCINNLELDSMLPFGKGLNPPSISFLTYALAVLLCIFYATELLGKLNNKYIDSILILIDYIGKHTLYIFLYHRLFLDYYLKRIDFGEYFWLKRLVYFFMMIGGSLIIEFLIRKIQKFVGLSYKYISILNDNVF